MAGISKAYAFANNEIAWLAWCLDDHTLPGCLGFHIVREYIDDNDRVSSERPLASYVPFKGQHNTDWQSQNTTVWPVQKFTWRDLTLRKKRDGSGRRPDNERVRYRIRAVGDMKHGLESVVVVPESHKVRKTGEVVLHRYDGTPRPLGYLAAAVHTNIIDVTFDRKPFYPTFTNGILSTQFLRGVLSEDGTIEPGELEAHLRKPGDWLRNYLSGDVLVQMRSFFEEQEGGRFRLALYELEDDELVNLIIENAERIDLILSDAGSSEAEGDGGILYDSRNAPARAALRAIAKKRGSKFRLHNRMFNGTGHIGHNKFAIALPDGASPTRVLTGSTNWTWTGVAGQSNNCIVIDNEDTARAFNGNWERLLDDKQPEPDPLDSKNTGAGQGDDLKTANRSPISLSLGNERTVEHWFSPNMLGKVQPSSSKTKPPVPPPDMQQVFTLMRKAKRAIFFLVFMPSRGGTNSIVSEAIQLGLKDHSLDVVGAISDTQAMWGYEAGVKTSDGKKIPASSPHTFREAGISVVRATALTDKEIRHELGDFSKDERLTLGRAIIHDKVLVIDPLDDKNCTVIFGSHNLGYRASYSNDENLTIVRGHQPLALAYTAHVLDVYDHYRFRAVEAEISAKAKKTSRPQKGWDGFLSINDKWQDKASRRLATYFTES